MIRQKNIYLDCDGVLLDSPAAKANFLNTNYNCNFNGDQYPSQWDYMGSGFDLHSATETFLNSPEFERIPPIIGAKDAVDYLSAHGYKMRVVTSISDKESVKIKRIRNLKYIFGDVFEDITMFPLGWNNKISFYQSVPYGIVVDDSIFNIQDALKCKHKAVFITIKHNSDWHEFAQTKGLIAANSLYEAIKSKLIR